MSSGTVVSSPMAPSTRTTSFWMPSSSSRRCKGLRAGRAEQHEHPHGSGEVNPFPAGDDCGALPVKAIFRLPEFRNEPVHRTRIQRGSVRTVIVVANTDVPQVVVGERGLVQPRAFDGGGEEIAHLKTVERPFVSRFHRDRPFFSGSKGRCRDTPAKGGFPLADRHAGVTEIALHVTDQDDSLGPFFCCNARTVVGLALGHVFLGTTTVVGLSPRDVSGNSLGETAIELPQIHKTSEGSHRGGEPARPYLFA